MTEFRRDLQPNRWCDILMAKSAGLVNRHYHPHKVFAYTISGKWGYLEHDWLDEHYVRNTDHSRY